MKRRRRRKNRATRILSRDEDFCCGAVGVALSFSLSRLISSFCCSISLSFSVMASSLLASSSFIVLTDRMLWTASSFHRET